MSRRLERTAREGYTSEELAGQLSDEQYVEGFQHPRIAEALQGTRYIRISVHPEAWVYLGRREDHVLVPRLYCSCLDFLVNVVGRRRKSPCYHLVGLELARKLGRVKDLSSLAGPQAPKIMLEILEHGFSRELRRLALRSQS